MTGSVPDEPEAAAARSQVAHDIETAKAWIQWAHDDKPTL